ncbi:MAG: hypothetical protein GY795_17670, partial [Desulfobacterales bacterium]|nr:hypothetical protein [Desulfobacterales bacterium]
EGEEEARGLFEDVGRRLKAGTPALPASPAEREPAQQALVRSEPIRRARETRPAARRLTEARRQTQALAQQAEQALAQPEPTADEVVQRAREIGVQEGFDPDRVFGILGPSQERTLTTAERSLDVAGVPETDIELADEADVTVDKLAEIRSGDRYADMKAEIVADIEAGRSWDEIEADARAGGSSAGFAGDASEESVIGRWPRTWRVLRAELRPFAPSLGDIRELEDAGFFDDEE